MKTLCALLLAAVLTIPALAAEEGLVARWDFDEGQGTVLGDAVGGCPGTIHGATWVKSGEGYALKFDGVDDFVDCGNPAALSPTEQITLEAWVYPLKSPTVGEPGVMGKAYHNYAITYYQDSKCWWYAGNSAQNAKASVPSGGWHHVVGTLDGKHLRLYVDGVLSATSQATGKPLAATENFYFGTSKGDVQWTKNATFCGMIDEARVYNRALTAEEIREHFFTTKLTNQPDVTAFPYYGSSEVIAQLDLRGLGILPKGASLTVQLTPRGQKMPVASAALAAVESYARPQVSLKLKNPLPGDYALTAQVWAGRGKAFGKPNSVPVHWPSAKTWGVSDPNIRVLNNLVSELRRASNLKGQSTLQFTNPREGWVFVSSTAGSTRGSISVTCPSAGTTRQLITQQAGQPAVAEAMRRLPAGKHELQITCSPEAVLKSLVVRSIPEIGYCRVDCGPQLAPYGPADWAFLEKHILPHINLAVSRGDAKEREKWEKWRQSGRRWIVETPLPGIGKREGVSAQGVYDAWVASPGVAEPLLDGLIVDEFAASDDPIWDSWHGALKRLRDEGKLKDKVFYPYCAPLFGAQKSREFTQTVLDEKWAVALERYLPEEPTEASARGAIQSTVVNTLRDWEEKQPGTIARTLLVWGFMISAPPESTNAIPSVDYKAFMDMQMQAIANDPTLFGLYGVTSYLSAYSDEETIRFVGKLYRHYCIEGRNDRLTDAYLLTHLRNPDFEEKLDSWTPQAAEAGSISTGTRPNLAWLQGRYPFMTRGDTYAMFKRSDQGLNALTQRAVGLKPGQLYSLKMISADFDDLETGVSKVKALPVKIEVDGVEVLPERTFQFPFRSCYSHTDGPFNAQNPAGMNAHNLLFRAKAPTAVVRISETEQGEVGDRVVFNFLELQPYYESK